MDLNQKLMDALGLGSLRHVTSVVLTLKPMELPEVVVTRLVTEVDTSGLPRVKVVDGELVEVTSVGSLEAASVDDQLEAVRQLVHLAVDTACEQVSADISRASVAEQWRLGRSRRAH